MITHNDEGDRYYRLNVRLRRDDPQDQAVIEALEQLGPRGKSRWVRRVLYETVTGPGRSEILAEIRSVKEAIDRLEEQGIGAGQPEETEEPEPEEAARNLDGMLERLESW